MTSNSGDDGGGQDDGATVVAGPSFDDMLAARGEAPVEEAPSWSQDLAFAETQMGQSYDELLSERGLPLPADVSPSPPQASLPQAPPPPPQASFPQPAPTAPTAPSPFAPGPPGTPAPQHTPAPGGQPPLAATMALDMSQSPIFAPGAPPPPIGGPPAPAPMAAMAPAPTAGKSRLVLFAATFAAVFFLGSLCFGSAALFYLM